MADMLKTKEWIIAELEENSGVSKSGSPQIVECPYGKAVSFNGKNDAYFFNENPLAGMSCFTVEAIFNPAADGEFEQRFLHMGESTAARMLLELRLNDNGTWYLDAFLNSGENGLALLDAELHHPAGEWYHAALVYENGTMKHYINKKLELSGEIDFPAMSPGKTSVGVRQNEISWFKGEIFKVKVTGSALTPDMFIDF